MNTSCITCGTAIPVGSGGRCRLHIDPVRRLRWSHRWAVMARNAKAIGVCAGCGARGIPLEADHRIALRDHPERAFDASNVQALCHACHTAKTNAMRRQGRIA